MPSSIRPLRHCLGSLLAFAVLAMPDRVAAQSYRVIELHPLVGDTSCSAELMTNDLQAVGRSSGLESRYVRWDADGHPTVLPVPPFTRSLRINNRGEIAGIRGLGPPPPFYPKMGFWPSVPFALVAESVVDLPGPSSATVSATELTDSGILLITQHWGLLLTGPSWAVYQATLYQLTAGSVVVQGISDSGLFGGYALEGGQFLQRPGGTPFAPWPDNIRVERIGPGGHVLGYGLSSAATIDIRFRTPDGTVTNLALPGGTLYTGRMNHAGDIVGRYYAPGSYLASVFLYRNGQLIDLNAAIGAAGGRLYDARQITDTGAILASRESSSPSCGVYVVPAAPAAPADLTFTLEGLTVTLRWSLSAGAIDYVVEAGSAPWLSNLYRASVGDTAALTVTAPLGRYYVRVRARNAVGESDPSNEVIVEVR